MNGMTYLQLEICWARMGEAIKDIGLLTFAAGDLKVPVFQKDSDMDVPVCYCFDWTRVC